MVFFNSEFEILSIRKFTELVVNHSFVEFLVISEYGGRYKNHVFGNIIICKRNFTFKIIERTYNTSTFVFWA